MILGYIDPGTGFTVVGLGAWLVAFLAGSLGVFMLFFKKIFKFFKKHNRIIIVVILTAVILTAIGALMNQKGEGFNKRVVILGFDGLSPSIMEPMMEKGSLPNFSRLKAEGSYRHLATTNPSQSPVAWSGFATGKNAGKHSIYDFIKRDPATYSLSLSLSNIKNGKPLRVVKSRPFWQYTSEADIPTTIISCPVTFPPDRVNGRMIAGMGVPDILGTEGTFTFYTTEAPGGNKDVGGKVFRVKSAPTIRMNLIGPKVSKFGNSSQNTTVEFNATINKDRKSALIEYQSNRFEMKAGEWSGWKEVTFDLGLFRKAKGILKFYLVEIEPEFKLYISPIDFDPRDPLFQLSYPKGYSRELVNHIGLYHTRGMPIDTWALNEKRLPEAAFLEEAEDVLREKQAMLDFELNRLREGILFCYFESPDIIQHMFWRYIDKQHPLYREDAPAEYKNKIEEWYIRMDDILGRVMDRIDRDDTIIVLSDHGFGAFRRAVHINTWLRKNGYLKLRNPQSESGSELLSDVDWSKTKAYAIGFGAVYINQLDRERNGIVEPGPEKERLKDEISDKLKKLIDDENGKPVVKNVYRNEEIFSGKYAKNAPDLYVGFNIGYRASWQTALGAAPDGLIEDNLKKWSGSHLFDPGLIPGVIFSNKRFNKDKPSIYDIAPTILKFAGYDDKRLNSMELDGTALFD